MQKQTIIERIEIEPQTGNVSVKMLKQVVDDDGVTVLGVTNHRMMIAAGANAAAQIAVENASLAGKGFPSIASADVDVLNAALGPLSSLRSAKAAEQAAKGNKP